MVRVTGGGLYCSSYLISPCKNIVQANIFCLPSMSITFKQYGLFRPLLLNKKNKMPITQPYTLHSFILTFKHTFINHKHTSDVQHVTHGPTRGKKIGCKIAVANNVGCFTDISLVESHTVIVYRNIPSASESHRFSQRAMQNACGACKNS